MGGENRMTSPTFYVWPVTFSKWWFIIFSNEIEENFLGPRSEGPDLESKADQYGIFSVNLFFLRRTSRQQLQWGRQEDLHAVRISLISPLSSLIFGEKSPGSFTSLEEALVCDTKYVSMDVVGYNVT